MQQSGRFKAYSWHFLKTLEMDVVERLSFDQPIVSSLIADLAGLIRADDGW
jgi:hypothetical protein